MPNATEQIDLPGDAERRPIRCRRGVGKYSFRGGRSVIAHDRSIGGNLRPVAAARDSCRSPRLFDSSGSGAQILVGGQRTRLEFIERGISEKFPPFTTRENIGWFANLPRRTFGGPEARRSVDRRLSGEQGRCNEKRNRKRFHEYMGAAYHQAAGLNQTCCGSTARGAGAVLRIPSFSSTT